MMRATSVLEFVLAISVAASVVAAEPPPNGAATTSGVERVSVYVNGMACPFCAYNIEKRIKTLKGVDRNARVDVSVKRGIVSFEWKRDVRFDPSAVREQIRRAGFTPGDIEISALGTIDRDLEDDEGRSGRLRMLFSSTGQIVLLAPATPAEVFTALKKSAAQLGRGHSLTVRIYGTVHQDKDTWYVSLDRWESA